MLKTFTLLKKDHIETDEHHGKMTFLFKDELGNERVVEGDTYLDDNKEPRGISSSNKRELPLIEDMLHLDVGEAVDIEFDAYNNVYNRELDKTINQIAYDKVLEMQNERSLFYKLKKMFGMEKDQEAEKEKAA